MGNYQYPRPRIRRRCERERFAEKTCPEPNSGCLLWTGSDNGGRAKPGSGHGKFWLDGRMQQAHRVAWLLHHGAWPSKALMHICDTPQCVNVAHMREGTQAENMADCFRKGRHPKVKAAAYARDKTTD